MPPEQRSTAKKNSGDGDTISNKPAGRQRLIRRILRTMPRPLAVEEAEAAGFSREEIEAAIRQMWG